MQMTHPNPIRFNSDFGREIRDEARAERIHADSRIVCALQDAINEGRWPDLTKEQCARLIDVLTDAMA
jgi:hypothetical protein